MHVLKSLLKIGGWFAVVSAIMCLIISVIAYWHARNFMHSAIRAPGTVIRLEQHGSESGTFYYPIVTYRDVQGATQELYSSVGSFPPSHNAGEAVTVLYVPGQPHKAKLDGFFDVWGLAAITGGLGGFWLVGLAMLLVIQRSQRRPPVLSAASSALAEAPKLKR
jgi:hypothetical protein